MLRLSAPCGALPDSAPLVGVSGGGFNLAWMLGVAHEMRASGVPMRRCVFSGASAGAGVAALMCCDADFRGSLEWALALPEVQHAFERPWGALGMAATMGRRVMDRFLPADAAQRCEGRLFVLLHDVQKGHRFQSSFRDREDLIDAVLTSAHVPLLSDGRLMRRHAGGYYVDGAWFSTRDAVLLCRPGAAMRVLVDHSEDAELHEDGLPWWSVAGPEIWRKRFDLGCAYGKRLKLRGHLPRAPPYSISPVSIL